MDGLFSIDIDTGLATEIDIFPQDPSDGALAVGPDGVLYAAFATIEHLVIVNPITGQLTDVGAFGFDDVSGMAFGSDGTLYGHDDTTCQLITIDIETGAGIAIGDVGFFSGAGLAFSPEGVLYSLGVNSGDGPKLWTIDLKTGAGTEIGLLGELFGFDPISTASGLEFVGETLYASCKTLNEGIGALVIVDTATGDASLAGIFSEDQTQSMTGMAFLPGSGDVDRDGDVDIVDYEIFVGCFTGPLDPGGEPLPVGCVFLDSDDDSDIDCLDWEVFIVNWTEDEEPPTFDPCDATGPCSGEPTCEGDANCDATVDPLDAGFVQARFGCPVNTGDPECDAADVSVDGAVDPLDVGYVLARFGECE